MFLYECIQDIIVNEFSSYCYSDTLDSEFRRKLLPFCWGPLSEKVCLLTGTKGEYVP